MPQVRILSLNINNVASKLEDYKLLNLLLLYDIVCLCEIKCDYPFSLPGYKCLRSRIIPSESKRGGVAVLFKNKMFENVYNVVPLKDQLWFSVSTVIGIRFGAVYIAPKDSMYFTQDSFATISDQCHSSRDGIIILGDMNARIPNLEEFACKEDGISYSPNPDTCQNANGKDLISVCQSYDMVPLNHLKHHDLKC